MLNSSNGMLKLTSARESLWKSVFSKRTALVLLQWLAMAAIFALAYTQKHLYNDNQNTKFLHGLAQAGAGLLGEDWLANTTDPLPVFSLFVQIVYSINPAIFYLVFALLMGVYAYSLVGIAAHLFRIDRSFASYALFFTLLVAMHAFEMSRVMQRTFNFDLTLLQYGVAGQYLLGEDFQNSTFGVFLLLSIYAFLQRKNLWAILWLCLACVFHSAYLFGGGLLTAAYLLVLFLEKFDFRQRSWGGFISAAREPFLLGLLALVLIAPLLWYNQVILSSTSPDAARESMRIMVHERIPHHSLASAWLTRWAVLQFGFILAALALVRKSRLFPLMLVPLLGGVLLTGIQILTGSDSLAFLAPWRVSVFLVPLSTTLIVAWLIGKLFDWIKAPPLWVAAVLVALSLGVLGWLVYRGVDHQVVYLRNYWRDKTKPVMDWVRDTKAPGQVYLIPPTEGKFDEFRLYTGAPTFITWKSHPYRDFEILEWDRRVHQAAEFYAAEDEQACSALSDLVAEYHITHVVYNVQERSLDCTGVEETYRDKRFALYAIK